MPLYFDFQQQQQHPVLVILLFCAFTGVLGLIFLRRPKTKEPKIIFERASAFTTDAVAEQKYDVILIGTGPGACTCANLLAHMGKHVLMLEKHPTVTGGGTHSFHMENCEWDTGLHYTSKAMSMKTERPGAIMDFMSHGKQHFYQFPEPYDEILFPDYTSYPYMNGKEKTIKSILEQLHHQHFGQDIDCDNEHLQERVETFMNLYTDIHQGFVALGLSRILPSWLHFLVRHKVQQLMVLAKLTVRDVLYAIFNLGYTKELLLQHPCPHAPSNVDHDHPLRQRLKAGKYEKASK